MSTSQRISAAVGYIPVFGWIYAFLVERRDQYVMFHLRQAISLVLTLAGLFALWFVVAWILFAIPYADIFAMAFFALFRANGSKPCLVAIDLKRLNSTFNICFGLPT